MKTNRASTLSDCCVQDGERDFKASVRLRKCALWPAHCLLCARAGVANYCCYDTMTATDATNRDHCDAAERLSACFKNGQGWSIWWSTLKINEEEVQNQRESVCVCTRCQQPLARARRSVWIIVVIGVNTHVWGAKKVMSKFYPYSVIIELVKYQGLFRLLGRVSIRCRKLRRRQYWTPARSIIIWLPKSSASKGL